MESTLGQIQQFGFRREILGWELCHGQEMRIQQHPGLFSLLGTYFGGDGTRTFKLPDLRIKDPDNGQYYQHGDIMKDGIVYLESRISIGGEYPRVN